MDRSPFRRAGSVADDHMNPLDLTNPDGPLSKMVSSRNNNAAEKRRHSSTFSTYYLNKQAKELASLMSIDDRNRQDFILEKDGFDIQDLAKTTLPD